MGTCVEKVHCPACNHKTLQTFLEDDGRFTGFCFRCGTYNADPYGANPPDKERIQRSTAEDILAQLREIQTFPILPVPDRKLGQRTMEYFGVRTSMSEFTGQPAARYYPYRLMGNPDIVAYKVKTTTKQMYTVGNIRDADMFGWEQAMRYGHTYSLFITEGEDDCLALFGALKKQWEQQGEPAVISLRTGAKGVAKDINRVIDQIERKFRRVVLVFDNDEPGREATKSAVQLLSGRKIDVLVASLPLKDANDMTIAGREAELVKAVMYEASKKISTNSYRSSEIWHLAEQVIEQGIPWPYPTATSVTRGIRRKEVYYFGAGKLMPAINALNCWKTLT